MIAAPAEVVMPKKTPPLKPEKKAKKAFKPSFKQDEGYKIYTAILGTNASESVFGGIDIGVVDRVRDLLDITKEDSYQIFGLSKSTYNRRVKDGLLTRDESDRAYRVAKVLRRATSVLGSKEKAQAWLKKANYSLGMQEPLNMLETEFGTDQVMNLLGRIEHGVFS